MKISMISCILQLKYSILNEIGKSNMSLIRYMHLHMQNNPKGNLMWELKRHKTRISISECET